MFNFNPDKLPLNEGWLPMATETPGCTDLVPVSPERMQGMYSRVTVEFHATLSQEDYKVYRIYRLQSLDLWNKYHKYVSATYEYCIVISY